MLSIEVIDALNKISTEINSAFGFKDGLPRINQGPCGPFAKAFFTIWNELFTEKVTICFLFRTDPRKCTHCFIKLPDGSYFDGGNGVVLASYVQERIQPDQSIEEMTIFDEKELEKNTNGLNRSYHDCPNYSNDVVICIVRSYLERLYDEVGHNV